MATVNTLMKLVLNIQYQAQGWSEVHYLRSNSFSDAVSTGGTIAAWRANALAPGCVMTWARCSWVDKPRNTVAVLDAPIKPRVYTGSTIWTGAVQDPVSALHYRFETAEGLWANRMFRGIPDAFINALAIQTAGGTLGPWPAATPLPDLTDVSLQGFYIFQGLLRVLLDNTCMAKKLPGPIVGWDLTDWNRIVLRKVADRQTGRPFGVPRGRARKRVPAPV